MYFGTSWSIRQTKTISLFRIMNLYEQIYCKLLEESAFLKEGFLGAEQIQASRMIMKMALEFIRNRENFNNMPEIKKEKVQKTFTKFHTKKKFTLKNLGSKKVNFICDLSYLDGNYGNFSTFELSGSYQPGLIFNGNTISVEIGFYDNYAEQHNTDLLTKIREVIVHEIEHMNQERKSEGSKFEHLSNFFEKDKLKNTENYYLQPNEIGAFVVGLKKRADIERNTLLQILQNSSRKIEKTWSVIDKKRAFEMATKVYDARVKFARTRYPELKNVITFYKPLEKI